MSSFKPFSTAALAFTVVLLGGNSADAAKPPKGERATALFSELDTNGDKKLSKDEFAKLEAVKSKLEAAEGKKKTTPAPKGTEPATPAAKGKREAAKAKKDAGLFDRLDTDKDGFLSPAEFGKLERVEKAKKPKGSK